MPSLERSRRSLDEEGRALVERLGGRWTPAGGMCRCPAHEDRSPSLSVRAGRTRLLLHCFAGCSASEVLRALDSQRLLVPSSAAPDRPSPKRSDGCTNGAALRIWRESRAVRGTAAERYLASRGLHVDSPQLRFHPGAPHGPARVAVRRPALIAAVRDESGLLAVHRTFVDPGGTGLARLEAPRAGLGRFGRGSVRLGAPGPRLGLAEGIETALSATALFGIPCWATLGAERFGRVSLPGGLERLFLFIDNDPGGRRAEALARGAFARVARIETLCPPRAGDDWNDVLRGRA
jgi:hypothetical protein